MLWANGLLANGFRSLSWKVPFDFPTAVDYCNFCGIGFKEAVRGLEALVDVRLLLHEQLHQLFLTNANI